MKLCPHIHDGSAAGLDVAVNGKSPAVKLVGGFSRANDYKIGNAGRLVWGRVYPGPDDLWRSMSPEIFYAQYLRPQFTHPANEGVDAWESGLNEDFRKSSGETPDYADMAFRAAYEAVIVELAKIDGKRVVVGQFAVGTPSGTPEEQRQAWRSYAPALRAVFNSGGYVSIHAYGNISGWTGPLDALVAVTAELKLSVPVLISECGNEPGWRSTGMSAMDFAGRLIQYDEALQRYPQVKAAAMFSYGMTGEQWRDYNMDDSQLTQALVSYGSQVAPTPPEAKRFSFPGAGMSMKLYDAPNGRLLKTVKATWQVDVYQLQGEWWRVTTAPQTIYWVRMSFI